MKKLASVVGIIALAILAGLMRAAARSPGFASSPAGTATLGVVGLLVVFAVGSLTYFRIKDDPKHGWPFLGGTLALVALVPAVALFFGSHVVLEPRYQGSLAAICIAFAAFAALYRAAGNLGWVRNVGRLLAIALVVKLFVAPPYLPVPGGGASSEWDLVPYPWTHPGMFIVVLLVVAAAALGLLPAFRDVPTSADGSNAHPR